MSHLPQTIKLKEAELANSSQLPLLYLDVVYSADAPRMHPSAVDEASRHKLDGYRNFEKVSTRDIAHLRALVFQQKFDSEIDAWCEKLLRFLEVRYASLKQRSQQRTTSETRILFTQIASLFLEIYQTQKDMRYLNTALKLRDLPWAQPGAGSEMLASSVLASRNEGLIAHFLKAIVNE